MKIEIKKGKDLSTNFVRLWDKTMKDSFDKNSPILRTRLVQGSAVISIDYFKRMLAALRNIVGGEVKSYETLVDRARREATLRMKRWPGMRISY